MNRIESTRPKRYEQTVYPISTCSYSILLNKHYNRGGEREYEGEGQKEGGRPQSINRQQRTDVQTYRRTDVHSGYYLCETVRGGWIAKNYKVLYMMMHYLASR